MRRSLLPLATAFIFAIAGAAGVQLSMIASDGYLIIIYGPCYLAICGIPMLLCFANTLRFLTCGFSKWLWCMGLCVAALFATSFLGLAFGSFVNDMIFKWPSSDHHLP